MTTATSTPSYDVRLLANTIKKRGAAHKDTQQVYTYLCDSSLSPSTLWQDAMSLVHQEVCNV